MRRVAVVAALACAVASTEVRADAEGEAFKRWAQGLSDAQHLPICAWGQLAHAASRSPGRFVWLNDPARPHAHWLVFESAGRRWWTRHEERAVFGGEELSCDRKVPLTWMKLQALTLQFLDQSNVPDIKQVITLLDGDVVLLSDHRAGYHDDFFTNWVTGLNSFHDPHPRMTSGPSRSSNPSSSRCPRAHDGGQSCQRSAPRSRSDRSAGPAKMTPTSPCAWSWFQRG